VRRPEICKDFRRTHVRRVSPLAIEKAYGFFDALSATGVPVALK